MIWQPDVGVPAAAWDQWLLPNDVSEPAFDGTNFRPIDFFLRTFPLVLLNMLCKETNRYFSQSSQQQSVNESVVTAAGCQRVSGHSSRVSTSQWSQQQGVNESVVTAAGCQRVSGHSSRVSTSQW